MQPIERYGVVALLILVATFTAVLVAGEGTVLGAATDATEGGLQAQRNQQRAVNRTPVQASSQRLRMTAGIQAAPLQRDRFPEQRAAQEEQEALEQARMLQERVMRAEREAMLLASLSKAEGVGPLGNASRGGFAQGGPVAQTVAYQAPQEASRVSETAGHLREYTVKAGDTLGEIALAKLGTSKVWKMITEVNPGLTPAKLYVNRKILLPSQADVAAMLAKRGSKGKSKKPKATQPSPKPTSKVAKTASATYTVAPGESLWRIAQRQLGDGKRFSEIIALNPGINPNQLSVGQKLQLPTKTKTKPKTQRASAAIAQKQVTKRTGRVR